MSLIKIAKKKACADERLKAKEDKQKKDTRKILNKILVKLTKDVLLGLKEFHNVKTKEGTLKLSRKICGKQVAVLKLNDVDLLYVDSSIESGYYDLSDDCRNEPYTDASVRVHSKDMGDYTVNSYLTNLGLKPYYGSVNDLEKIENFLKQIAEWLAPLF